MCLKVSITQVVKVKIWVYKYILICLLVGFFADVWSQGAGGLTYNNRKANFWQFGQGLQLDFNCSPPRHKKIGHITLGFTSMSTISDECGDLMFYATGDSIWNLNHIPLINPIIPLIGSASGIQSSIIIPKPENVNTHYFFSCDRLPGFNFNGLSYSEIAGSPVAPGVVFGNRVLARNTHDVVTAVEDGSGNYWVLVKIQGQKEFRAFKVTSAGVDTNAVISNPAFVSDNINGEMKFSPDGRFVAIASPLQILKFNVNTGIVEDFMDSSKTHLFAKTNSVTFSPSSRYLFTNLHDQTDPNLNGIYKFDLSYTDTADIRKKAQKISHLINTSGGIQTAPDGNIYVIHDPTSLMISVITNPDGISSNYEHNKIPLRGLPGRYFPNFPSSWVRIDPFTFTKNCQFDSTLFEINDRFWEGHLDGGSADSMVWTFYDSAMAVTTRINSIGSVKYNYQKSGCFFVGLSVFGSKNGGKTANRFIRVGKAPTVDIGPRDTSLCLAPRVYFKNAVTADNPDSEYEWYYRKWADTSSSSNEPLSIYSTQTFITMADEGRFWLKKTFQCCSLNDTIDIHHDSITPFFRVNDGVQCEYTNDFKFTNTSIPAFKATEWDMGNGKKVSGDVVNFHYDQVGTYTAEMTATSPGGCKAKLSRIMLVVNHPDAYFSLDTSQLCFRDHVFKIKDSSTIKFGQGGLTKWEFDLGDSTKSNLKQFTKSYKKAGAYEISLIVTSSQDCQDTARQTVRIYERPFSGFKINDTSQCLASNLFIITDTSTSSFDTINYRTWNFGDGSPLQNRSKLPKVFGQSYNSVDSFKLQLVVGTGPGCYDTSAAHVYVRAHPVVDFSINQPEQCVDGNLYNFIDTISVQKGFVQSKFWYFGDSTPVAISGLNKKYGRYGSYPVKLKAFSNHGCTDSITKSVLLHPMPKAQISVDKDITCYKEHSFQFSSDPSFVPVGSIATYDWDFGDTTTSNQKNPPIKTYANNSQRTVQLALVSDKGCVDTTKKIVRFYPIPVAFASVTPKVQCIEENLFYFNAEGSYAIGGSIKEYLWQYGDGTIDVGKTPGGKFYLEPDTFDILLKITTTNDCTDTASTQVVVLPSPVANFDVDPTCLFEPTEFKNKSYSKPGSITNWDWNLGDGTTTKDSTPIHTYENTGAYTITLKVLSNYGCNASVTKINEAVVKALPQSKFSYKVIESDERNTTIQFLDSSIDADLWYWTLGKGNVSNQQNPRILYNDTATIPVKLIIGNKEGCFDTSSTVIFVAPEYIFHVPNAFTPNGDERNNFFGGEGTLYYKDYDLKVFNRWGQLVFHSTSPLDKWDGTFNGEACPIGAYTYLYRIRDVFGFYHNYSGVINLLR